ncbi:unnamed protein product [marine sediment metagenome]|uniref:Uncharacterized protein n=1 Tax=marine sediment metagenome TaxID=412755 RepID=X1F7C7_9ZZZZ
MTFPRDYEDKVLLNIVWAYFAKLITKEQMLKHLDKMTHSFKDL